MKAFASVAPMSEDLDAILNDPEQAKELGEYLITRSTSRGPTPDSREFKLGDRIIRVSPTRVVKKSA